MSFISFFSSDDSHISLIVLEPCGCMLMSVRLKSGGLFQFLQTGFFWERPSVVSPPRDSGQAIWHGPWAGLPSVWVSRCTDLYLRSTRLSLKPVSMGLACGLCPCTGVGLQPEFIGVEVSPQGLPWGLCLQGWSWSLSSWRWACSGVYICKGGPGASLHRGQSGTGIYWSGSISCAIWSLIDKDQPGDWKWCSAGSAMEPGSTRAILNLGPQVLVWSMGLRGPVWKMGVQVLA